MKTVAQNSTELCSALKGLPHAKKTSTTARERAYWGSPAASRVPSFVHTTVPRLPSRVGANYPPQPSTALRARHRPKHATTTPPDGCRAKLPRREHQSNIQEPAGPKKVCHTGTMFITA